MRTFISILLVLFSSVKMAYGQQISARLENASHSSEMIREDYIPILIKLKASANIKRSAATLAEKQKQLIEDLQQTATFSQQALLNELNEGIKTGEVKDFRSHWLVNLIVAKVKASFIENLKTNATVEFVDLDVKVEYEGSDFHPDDSLNWPDPNNNYSFPAGYSSKVINADRLWRLGYTGQGRIMMLVDTGVKGNHKAVSRNWRGNHVPYDQAWLDCWETSTTPFDAGPHGTYVAELMGGLDTIAHDTVGVAFNAEWIASNAVLTIGYSYVLAAYEWAMNPDGDINTSNDIPDVINNSWHEAPSNTIHCNPIYAAAFATLEEAGIAVVFSAGNEGPSSQTIYEPLDNSVSVVNPFTVGAISSFLLGRQDPVALFSSRGPSPRCAGTFEGSLAIKPEIAAPGDAIRIIDIENNYRNVSGTSFSSPLVSGAIVLLKQAFPNLSSETIKLALYNTAIDLGEAGEDNSYGKGLIDVYAAYQYLHLTCDNQIAINNTIFYTPKKLSAAQRIVANSDIIRGVHAELTAGDAIVFKPGFRANRGSFVSASIQVCENNETYVSKISSHQTNGENAIVNGYNVKQPAQTATDAMKVYPTVTSDYIKIENPDFQSQAYSLMVIDGFGKVVFYNDKVNNNFFEVSLTKFSNGIYYARIQKEKIVKTFQIIKQ